MKNKTQLLKTLLIVGILVFTGSTIRVSATESSEIKSNGAIRYDANNDGSTDGAEDVVIDTGDLKKLETKISANTQDIINIIATEKDHGKKGQLVLLSEQIDGKINETEGSIEELYEEIERLGKETNESTTALGADLTEVAKLHNEDMQNIIEMISEEISEEQSEREKRDEELLDAMAPWEEYEQIDCSLYSGKLSCYRIDGSVRIFGAGTISQTLTANTTVKIATLPYKFRPEYAVNKYIVYRVVSPGEVANFEGGVMGKISINPSTGEILFTPTTVPSTGGVFMIDETFI